MNHDWPVLYLPHRLLIASPVTDNLIPQVAHVIYFNIGPWSHIVSNLKLEFEHSITPS